MVCFKYCVGSSYLTSGTVQTLPRLIFICWDHSKRLTSKIIFQWGSKESSAKWLLGQPKEFCDIRIRKIRERWDECLNVGGWLTVAQILQKFNESFLSYSHLTLYLLNGPRIIHNELHVSFPEYIKLLWFNFVLVVFFWRNCEVAKNPNYFYYRDNPWQFH